MLPKFARLSWAGLIAIALAVLVGEPRAAAAPDPPGVLVEDGYELWTACSELPDDFEFLPVFLGSDSPGFVDLKHNIEVGGAGHRALQYTRDKDLGIVPIRVGRWYGGMGWDSWPAQTVDPARQYESFQVTAWEVDGTRYPLDPNCILTLATEEEWLGLHSTWVRFTEPGQHSLKVFARQIAPFFFRDPLVRTHGVDPLGLDGRRVFVSEELVGDVLDQQFVHQYDLRVTKRD